MKDILVDQIQHFIDNKSLNSKLRSALELLLEAVNDWPDAVESLLDFERKINDYLNCSATKENLRAATKNRNLEESAWYLESIASVILVFDIYKGQVSFNDIINALLEELTLYR